MLKHIEEHVLPLVARLNSSISPYHEKVWIVGDGRSGTNWLSSIINHDGKSRLFYEPIHPEKVAAMNRLGLFEYQRPEEENAGNDRHTERYACQSLQWIETILAITR